MFRDRIDPAHARRPVFVTSLPRAGTTVLLEALAALPEFAAATYRHMPFTLLPLIWTDASRRFQQAARPAERAHGDGLAVGFDSPEAFEETLWMAFWPAHYQGGAIRPWTADARDAEFESFFRQHMAKVVAAGAAGVPALPVQEQRQHRAPAADRGGLPRRDRDRAGARPLGADRLALAPAPALPRAPRPRRLRPALHGGARPLRVRRGAAPDRLRLRAARSGGGRPAGVLAALLGRRLRGGARDGRSPRGLRRPRPPVARPRAPPRRPRRGDRRRHRRRGSTRPPPASVRRRRASGPRPRRRCSTGSSASMRRSARGASLRRRPRLEAV